MITHLLASKAKDLISVGASEASKVQRIMARIVPVRGFEVNIVSDLMVGHLFTNYDTVYVPLLPMYGCNFPCCMGF